MRYLLSFFVFVFILSCQTSGQTGKQTRQVQYKKTYTDSEQKIMQAAHSIIDSAYYGSLISMDAQGQAKVRIMEPFAPEKHFVIYLATNPRSRKVQEIKQNPKVTMHYFDRNNPGYVSLYGNAFIVENKEVKAKYWKEAWKNFYKNREDDYTLIRFVPDYLEVISIRNGLTGDKTDWKPSKVVLIQE